MHYIYTTYIYIYIYVYNKCIEISTYMYNIYIYTYIYTDFMSTIDRYFHYLL